MRKRESERERERERERASERARERAIDSSWIREYSIKTLVLNETHI